MKEKLKHGSIYKITLENFTTYSNVEFFPGQSLNLIIGPNGSGKSSIISAIILGLGGEVRDDKTKEDITNFIKRGSETAKIEIELYHKGKSNTIVITTTLKKSEKKMLYQKNHKIIEKKDLFKFVSKSMGIQVSNLCQVLPQLRVAEFSKMNPQQLLVNTVSAISDFDGVIRRKDLIDKSTKLKSLESENQTFVNQVLKLKKQNSSDESKVRDVEEQTRLRREEEVCRMKVNWLEYKIQENNLINYKKELECENKVFEDLESEKKKKEKEKDDIAKTIRCVNESVNITKKEIGRLEEETTRIKNSMYKSERQFNEIDDSLEQKKMKNSTRDNELKVLDKELKEKEQDLSKFENEYGNESSLQEQRKEKDEIIKTLHQRRNQLETDILCIKNDLTSIINSINTCKEDLAKLNDKYDTKVLLKQNYEDTYEAMKWLEKNRSLFQQRVYGPMLLEIDFDNEEDAKFLENTVSIKDLTAFCFEDTQDMEKFLKIVRSELGYKRVNACKLSTETNLSPPPIDNIAHLGFSRYLSAALRAPAALAQHLRARHRLHEVPHGAPPAHAQLPAHVRLYFTDEHKVVVKTSADSGLQTKYTTLISPSKFLKSYKAPIKSIEDKLNELVNDKNDKTEKLESLNSVKDNLDQKIEEEEQSCEDIRKKIVELKKIKKSIVEKRMLYEKKENVGKVDMQEEEERARQKRADITRALVTKQADLLKNVRRLHAAELYYGKLEKHLEDIKKKFDQCKINVKECDIRLNNQKNERDIIQNKINECKSKMDLIKDIRDDNGKLPNDPDFLHKKEFDQLPEGDLLRMKCLKIQQNHKFTEDYSQYKPILKQYEDRAKKIIEINKEIEEKNKEIEELQEIINEMEPSWKSDVQELVDNISERFTERFKKLGYTGQVLFDTDQDDISKYGMNIMVSYGAAGAAPARLDAGRQSGGERSAAVVCFLLALQGVAAAPFRCLDEINQGMDTKNERNFLNLLMDVSSEESSCQYFVLSPKLLKNLEYNDTAKVHVIMSGEFNVPSNVWEKDNFLEKAKKYGNENSDVDE